MIKTVIVPFFFAMFPFSLMKRPDCRMPHGQQRDNYPLYLMQIQEKL